MSIVRISPYKNICISRAIPGFRLASANPSATTAENSTPITVSEERELRRFRNMIPNPISSASSGMVIPGLIEQSNPSATPAKALCPIASEKKDIRKFTTWIPAAAASGAQIRTPRNASCIKRSFRHSNGSSAIQPHKTSINGSIRTPPRVSGLPLCRHADRRSRAGLRTSGPRPVRPRRKRSG